MPYCGVINCNSNRNYPQPLFRIPKIPLFRFPKVPERSKKWLINIQRADLMKKDPQYLHQNIRICALHFEASQFMNAQKKRLVWNAVPTLFEIPKKAPAVGLKRKVPIECSEPELKEEDHRALGIPQEESTAEEEAEPAARCDEIEIKDEPESTAEDEAEPAARCDEIEIKDEPIPVDDTWQPLGQFKQIYVKEEKLELEDEFD